MKEIIKILPEKIWYEVLKYQADIEEIRLRENKFIAIRIHGKIKVLKDYIVKKEDLQQIIGRATEFSIHLYINEMKNGFITIASGHRIGVCGEGIFEHGKIINFRTITSLNIRIAKSVDDFDTSIFENIEGKNILIISPPNYGKTTLLRKLCKYLSKKNYTLSVIDERFEIGLRQNLGTNVDILQGVPKNQGINLMIKSMSPDYLVLDEITSEVDILKNIANCGVKIIATIHAKDVLEVKKKEQNVLQYFDAVIEIYLCENNRKYVVLGRDSYV